MTDPLAAHSHLSNFFTAVALGDVPAAPDSRDGIRLRVTAEKKSPRIELVRQIGTRQIVGTVSNDYLWQFDAVPANAAIVVTGDTGQVLFEQASADVQERARSNQWHSSSRELFLHERFAAEPWFIRFDSTAADRNESIAQFRWLLLVTVLPILALLALLASVLIRRSHEPLERLIGATQALADGQFDTRVAESGDNDSRSLIRAFNEMAQRIHERDQALIRSAYFDDLTLLANRRSLQEHLQTQVQSSQEFALLFLDLDRFKLVNDATGHSAGDRLLRCVADRLKARLPDGYFIARLGGDEFTVVIPGVVEPAQVEAVMNLLSEPIALGEHAHVVSASIGIAQYPLDGEDAETLLRNADTAMYRAKRGGPPKYAFYRAEMNANAVRYVQVERDLRQALVNDEFEIHYQPQVDIRTGSVVGAEALLRWRHPTLGLLTPDRFLEVAEDTGLIVPIGERVIERVCRQYRQWKSAGIELGSIAFNASMAQLAAPTLVEQIGAALALHRIPRDTIEIEITETALARDIDSVGRVLATLRSMGVRVAIDDFGVGYSSLSYLQTLPFDVLKIDRAFIANAIPTDDAGSLCETIIAMANALRKQVVAEGVETAAQAQFLYERGCFVAQGYYYARPLTVAAFEGILRSARRESQDAVG